MGDSGLEEPIANIKASILSLYVLMVTNPLPTGGKEKAIACTEHVLSAYTWPSGTGLCLQWLWLISLCATHACHGLLGRTH